MMLTTDGSCRDGHKISAFHDKQLIKSIELFSKLGFFCGCTVKVKLVYKFYKKVSLLYDCFE